MYYHINTDSPAFGRPRLVRMCCLKFCANIVSYDVAVLSANSEATFEDPRVSSVQQTLIKVFFPRSRPRPFSPLTGSMLVARAGGPVDHLILSVLQRDRSRYTQAETCVLSLAKTGWPTISPSLKPNGCQQPRVTQAIFPISGFDVCAVVATFGSVKQKMIPADESILDWSLFDA